MSQRTLLTIIILISLTAVYQIHMIYSIRRINHAIYQLQNGNDVSIPIESSDNLKIAYAIFLAQKDKYEDATNLLNKIQANDQDIYLIAQYNLGNLYLKRALMLANESGTLEKVMPLIELAKQFYRNVLVADSTNWDAKYNLETALRILPELPKTESGEEINQALDEKLESTTSGVPTGLP